MRRSNYLPDHPVIRNMEVTGYPDGREYIPEKPHCPVCGQECEFIYELSFGSQEILGCEHCVSLWEAQDIDQCFAEERRR